MYSANPPDCETYAGKLPHATTISNPGMLYIDLVFITPPPTDSPFGCTWVVDDGDFWTAYLQS